MAGLLGGPLCQVAETALESVCDKVLLGKIGLQAFKAVKNGVNSPKLSEEDKIRLKFETIGAHIEGACRILKPAMELKNILLPESRSADRTRPGVNSVVSLHYYTPQKQSSQCRCVEGNQKKYSFESMYPKMKNRDNLKNQGAGNLREDSHLQPWKKCDACEAVSKSLFRTSCDHEICQKCVKSGRDCRKCLIPPIKIKSEPQEKLYSSLFDTD